ncbi:tyrosine-type recombinase/integrase [Mongoliimonas terrestris]|uniref:tyrosine-type recombinase/integrase n=1 Tax=Mongoliimonas terrestris TaxID=1709001 RepID=UPI0009498173|nr:tyrosine-type recombinase/integrase [Mongoliimonas terrestris]
MAKTLSESGITTRNARAKLKTGLHWRGIDPDVHLGYRKGVRGGRWLVRSYEGGGAYLQATLASADDALDADGDIVLSFDQAARTARAHVAKVRADRLAAAAGPVLTVSTAIEAYLAVREAKEEALRPAGMKRDARSRLTRYVLGTPLAATALHSLAEPDLEAWLAGLAKTLAPASVRRLVNDLKAAINLAARMHRARLPASLPVVVRNGLATPEAHGGEARRQILSDADVRRIVLAAQEVDARAEWDGDLARLVLVLAATGARFSQVARMTVADVQSADGRLMIPTSRKGRGAKGGRVGVRVGEDVLRALRPAIAGRKGPMTLLERWKHRQTEVGVWTRDRRAPWGVAAEMTRPWAAIIERAELPADTIPYALRHSSIVRGLRAGLPIRLVAGIHDTSAAMIERHYAAFVVDALDELAARAVVPLTV